MKLKTAALIFFFLLSTSFFGLKAELVDKIAAVVNDRTITLLELKKQMTAMAPSYGINPASDEELAKNEDLKKRTLDHMINEILIEDEIQKRSIEVSDTELESTVRNIMNQNGLKTNEELSSALALQGMSLPEYRKTLRKQLERSKIMSYAVRSKLDLSDQDLKNYYSQHLEESREPDSLHLKNIFIGKNKKNEAQKKAKAREALDMVKKGGDFDKLLKKYSEDSNAKSGGDLGFLTPKDLNPKIYSEVSKLKIGQTTGIIDTETGFYIIKLLESKKGEIRPFESIKDELKNKLTAKEMEEKFASWLLDLRSKSYIDIKI